MHTIQNPERRRFLQMSGLGALAALLPSGAFGDDAEQRPPNIVLILADDMGYGDLGCQNPDSKIPTPNLDRLASQGIRLTDAHSPSSVCSPTRYGILTGRYCWRSRLKSSVLWSWDPPLIDADRLTLPAMLKQRGYATACVGKWHLGWDWPFVREVEKSQRKAIPVDSVDWSQPIANGPIARGFDYYFGDDVPNFPPYIFIENDHVQGVPSEQKPKEIFGSPGPMLPGWKLEEVMPEITRKAAAWIDGAARNPETTLLPLLPADRAAHADCPGGRIQGQERGGRVRGFCRRGGLGGGARSSRRSNTTASTRTRWWYLPATTGRNTSPTSASRNITTTAWAICAASSATPGEGGHRVPLPRALAQAHRPRNAERRAGLPHGSYGNAGGDCRLHAAG